MIPALPRWLLALALFSASAAAAAYRIDRVEPASWWAGMRNARLQLLVHGKGIAALEPAVDDARARIHRITRTTNANYLFIDLLIAPAAPHRPDVIAYREAGRPDLRQVNAYGPTESTVVTTCLHTGTLPSLAYGGKS